MTDHPEVLFARLDPKEVAKQVEKLTPAKPVVPEKKDETPEITIDDFAKVGIIYWSSTGNTEAMAQAVEEGAKAAGADVEIMEVADADARNASRNS